MDASTFDFDYLNLKFRQSYTTFDLDLIVITILGSFYNNNNNNNNNFLCSMNVVEDEYHFVLVCQHNREIRNECLPKYYCHWPTLQKFKMLFTSQQSSILNKLAKYVFLATKLRSNSN